MVKATDVLIQISAEFMTSCKIAFFYYNRHHVADLIKNLQEYFNKSISKFFLVYF